MKGMGLVIWVVGLTWLLAWMLTATASGMPLWMIVGIAFLTVVLATVATTAMDDR
jgi:hypothetical protein